MTVSVQPMRARAKLFYVGNETLCEDVLLLLAAMQAPRITTDAGQDCCTVFWGRCDNSVGSEYSSMLGKSF